MCDGDSHTFALTRKAQAGVTDFHLEEQDIWWRGKWQLRRLPSILRSWSFTNGHLGAEMRSQQRRTLKTARKDASTAGEA